MKQIPIDLFDQQIEYVNSTSKYTFYNGAYRGGKSMALVVRAILLALETPNSINYVCAFTYPMIRRALFPIFKQVLKRLPSHLWKATWGNSPVIRFSNGAEIEFAHLQDDSGIQGATVDHLHLDEATIGIKKDVFENFVARGSLEHSTISICTNPGARSHYLHEMFFESPDNMANKNVIRSRTKDNPFLPDSYIDDLMTRPKTWRKRYMDGIWGTLEGAVYDEFDRAIHVHEFEWDPNIDWWVAMDWGFEHPFAALCVGIDSDGRVLVLDERYIRKVLTSEHAIWLNDNWKDQYKLRGFLGDPARPDNIKEMRLGLKIPQKGMIGEKGRINYVQAGIDAVQELLPIRNDGRAGLVIHPRCVNLIREIESYQRMRDKDGNVMEAPVKKDDDACDALRYFVMAFGSILKRR